MDYFTLLTQTGATKITAAAANNTTVNLTHIAVGDGAGSVVMPDASQTALVGETYKTQLSDLKVDDNNSNWLVAVGYIPSDVGNFWVREVGIFDEDGDLIAVGNYPETFKPVVANNVAKDLYISVIIETSNAEAVTLEIDPSIVMASRLYVEENFSSKQHKHDEEYAALNGSELQRFKVADAEEDDEAVNVNQLNNALESLEIVGAASTVTKDNLTASKVLVSNQEGKIGVSSITSVVLEYLSGLNSNLVTILNAKAPLLSASLTGTPTAPTPALTDDSTKIATTGFVKDLIGGSAAFAQSLSNNGYVKLASGLIIQWGRINKTTNVATVTATFPIAFPNACLTAVSGQFTNGYDLNYFNVVYNFSTTRITIRSGNYASWYWETWIAIGY